MCRPRRFRFIGIASTKESALKARRPVFSRLTLELTEAIGAQDGERVDRALIGRNVKVNDPVSRMGLQQLENDSTGKPVADARWREDVAR